MTVFDPEKFDEKYVHYFEELEAAYSKAFQELHDQYDSRVLKGVDHRILSESEPMYEGSGEFRIALPRDVESRIDGIDAEPDDIREVLDEFVSRIEANLVEQFEFGSE